MSYRELAASSEVRGQNEERIRDLIEEIESLKPLQSQLTQTEGYLNVIDTDLYRNCANIAVLY